MTTRMVRDNRLLYYREKADENFWANHWEQYNSFKWIESGRKGNISGFYHDVLLEYLPRDGIILEGGCGVGHLVAALKTRGFEVIGIEFSEQTVRKVNKLFPDVPIKAGNILCLEYPNNYFSTYISFGVVEHFENGPDQALTEAKRVLKNNGYLIVSVPYFNPLRKLKANLNLYNGANDNKLPFYQQAFTQCEFANILTRVGFIIEKICYYDTFKGFKDEIPFIGFLNQKGLIRGDIRKLINKVPLLDRLSSHMILFVAKAHKNGQVKVKM